MALGCCILMRFPAATAGAGVVALPHLALRRPICTFLLIISDRIDAITCSARVCCGGTDFSSASVEEDVDAAVANRSNSTSCTQHKLLANLTARQLSRDHNALHLPSHRCPVPVSMT